MKNQRAIVCTFSDFQGGHKQGLLHPETLLQEWDDDGNPLNVPVALNPAQSYLYNTFDWGLKETKILAAKDPIYVLANGDYTEGNKYPKAMVSTSRANQVTIAYDLMMHAYRRLKPKVVRLTVSTDSHAFDENAADVLLEKQLKLAQPAIDTKLVGHGLIQIGGALVDYSHHGPPGGLRKWLDGNLLRYMMKDVYIRERMAGNRPPDLVLRADKHVRVCEVLFDFIDDLSFMMWGATTPSFQFLTNFAAQVTQSAPTVTNGMLAAEIVNQKVVMLHWFTKTRDMRKREVFQ